MTNNGHRLCVAPDTTLKCPNGGAGVKALLHNTRFGYLRKIAIELAKDAIIKRPNIEARDLHVILIRQILKLLLGC
jgi:hypothetical protein